MTVLEICHRHIRCAKISFLILVMTVCFQANMVSAGDEAYDISIAASGRPLGKRCNDFFMLSIPKSGTHYVTKLLTLLSGKQFYAIPSSNIPYEHITYQKFNLMFIKCRLANQFLYGHTTPLYAPHFFQLSLEHPEYVFFLQIRDLRDVIVSYIYFRMNEIQAELGGNATFDQMLTHFLHHDGCSGAVSMAKNMQYAIYMITSNPSIYTVRFEDIIGNQGDGSNQKREATILQMASLLGISLSQQRLDEIQNQLFGNQQGPHSGTFRSGKIGSWQSHFKPYHIDLFNQKWGHYQIALGYPLS